MNSGVLFSNYRYYISPKKLPEILKIFFKKNHSFGFFKTPMTIINKFTNNRICFFSFLFWIIGIDRNVHLIH